MQRHSLGFFLNENNFPEKFFQENLKIKNFAFEFILENNEDFNSFEDFIQKTHYSINSAVLGSLEKKRLTEKNNPHFQIKHIYESTKFYLIFILKD